LLAVVVSYTANAILVAATEQLLTLHAPPGGAPPLVYFVVDLITQCLYTVAAGYLCRLIARSRRVAMVGLIGLGIPIGTLSLFNSWNAEPHWYVIALFVAYPPCVWIGWTLAI